MLAPWFTGIIIRFCDLYNLYTYTPQLTDGWVSLQADSGDCSLLSNVVRSSFTECFYGTTVKNNSWIDFEQDPETGVLYRFEH